MYADLINQLKFIQLINYGSYDQLTPLVLARGIPLTDLKISPPRFHFALMFFQYKSSRKSFLAL